MDEAGFRLYREIDPAVHPEGMYVEEQWVSRGDGVLYVTKGEGDDPEEKRLYFRPTRSPFGVNRVLLAAAILQIPIP